MVSDSRAMNKESIVALMYLPSPLVTFTAKMDASGVDHSGEEFINVEIGRELK